LAYDLPKPSESMLKDAIGMTTYGRAAEILWKTGKAYKEASNPRQGLFKNEIYYAGLTNDGNFEFGFVKLPPNKTWYQLSLSPIQVRLISDKKVTEVPVHY